jgi:ArsR family transcriptional regulator, arsenate/arsenite/antimonite-responsive transcriptional repressor
MQNGYITQWEVCNAAMNSIEDLNAVQIARALGDSTRFFIYKHIVEATEMRCQDICLDTPVRASTVSHHLKVLSDAGLITSRREGQGVYYRTVPKGLGSYLKHMRALERNGQVLRQNRAL